MHRRTSRRDRLLAVEERRFVVLLGILTLFIAYRADFPRDFPYPLPYPIPHLQIFVLPVFDRFVLVFGLYAFFMFVYFSEPLFPAWFREIFRKAAWMTLMAYWAYFFYISSGLLVSIFVPDQLILPYLIAFEVGLALIGFSLWEYLSGRKKLIRQTVHGLPSGLLTVTWLWLREVLETELGQTRLATQLRRLIDRRFQTALAILRTKLR